MTKKTHAMRFTDQEWGELQAIAKAYDCRGPNALVAAIANGEVALGDRVPDQQMAIEELQNRMKALEVRLDAMLMQSERFEVVTLDD